MDAEGRKRGTLRVFLGAAPGVGKTYAMLDEAHRRRERGVDIVVGLVETHGRAQTATMLEGLDVLPPFGVARPGNVAVGELVDERDGRSAGDDCRDVELGEAGVPVVHS